MRVIVTTEFTIADNANISEVQDFFEDLYDRYGDYDPIDAATDCPCECRHTLTNVMVI